MAETGVPIQKRATAWVSSVVVGMAMYFVFGSILTVAPAREREQVRRNIEALMAEAISPPTATPPAELQAAMAMTRATSASLIALSRREGELDQTFASRRAWAALIGLVACVGCFALCSAYWLGRGAREAGQV